MNKIVKVGPALLFAVFLLALSQAYIVAMEVGSVSARLAAVSVNTLLVLFFIAGSRFFKWPLCDFAITLTQVRRALLPGQRFWFFGPGVFIVVGAAVLCGLSMWLVPSSYAIQSSIKTLPSPLYLFMVVFWVPLIEEMLFRGFVSAKLRDFYSPVIAAYLSALGFSVLHTMSGISSLLSLELGVAVGPLLLALCCEGLRHQTRSIIPGVFLHAGCNLTPSVFTTLDSRWLNWLEVLYV